MTALLRRVPHMPGESATGYASRLGACNGVDFPTFCRHMGISRVDLVMGRRPALDALATLGDVDPGTLAYDAIVRQEDRRWSLRSQTLSSGTLRRLRPRFCPLCAAGDLRETGLPAGEAVHARSEWSVEPIRTCTEHGITLADPLPGGSGAAHDFATAFAPMMGTLGDVARGLRERQPSEAEAYLQRRLQHGNVGSAWLDSLDFNVASYLMEKLGAVAAFGREVHFDALSDDDLWHAGDVGYGLLESGERGLLGFMDMLQDTYKGSGSGKDGANSTYGSWWRSLNYETRSPGFEPVLDLLREHVMVRMPIEPATRLLGHVVRRRRMHSLTSAAAEFGCRPSRLRRMLATAGLLPTGHEGRRNALVVFDAEAAAPLLATVGNRMRGTEAMELLGVKSLKPFMREGLLVPLTGYADRRQRLYEFSRAEVQDFLHGMMARAAEVDEAKPGQVGLYDAPTVVKMSVGKMSRAILDGRTTGTCRLRGRQGLEAFLVDSEEMKGLLPRRPYDGLTLQELMRRLRTKHSTLVNLIKAGVFVPEVVIGHITGRRHRMVPFPQIRSFEADHVFLCALARERSCHPMRLKRELLRLGIKPILPPEMIGASVYLRSAVG